MKFVQKWLEKNRQKDEVEKKATALACSFIITLIIFMIWALTTFNSLTNLPEEENSLQNVASPTESFINSVKSVFSGTKNYKIDSSL